VQFLKDRFGIEWGPDVLGITQDGVTAKQSEGSDGLMEITLVAKCTRADVEEFVRLMRAKPAAVDGTGKGNQNGQVG
jgi:hypothetical protein